MEKLNRQLQFLVQVQVYADSLVKRMQLIYSRAHNLCLAIGVNVDFINELMMITTTNSVQLKIGHSFEQLDDCDNKVVRALSEHCPIFKLSAFSDVVSDSQIEAAMDNFQGKLIELLHDASSLSSKLAVLAQSEERAEADPKQCKLVEQKIQMRYNSNRNKPEHVKLPKPKKPAIKKSVCLNQPLKEMNKE